MVRNTLLAAVAVLATFAAGCAAEVDEATPAPEITIARANTGYETQIPNPRHDPNEKWVKIYLCNGTEQRVDPMVMNATTKVELVPPDVTAEEVAKVFDLPPVGPLVKCF